MKIKRWQLIEKFDTVHPPPTGVQPTAGNDSWLPDTVDFKVEIEFKCLNRDDEGYIGRLNIFSPFMGGGGGASVLAAWDIHTLRDTLIDSFSWAFGLLTVTDLYTANSVRVERNRHLREPGQQL